MGSKETGDRSLALCFVGGCGFLGLFFSGLGTEILFGLARMESSESAMYRWWPLMVYFSLIFMVFDPRVVRNPNSHLFRFGWISGTWVGYLLLPIVLDYSSTLLRAGQFVEGADVVVSLKLFVHPDEWLGMAGVCLVYYVFCAIAAAATARRMSSDPDR